MKKRGADEIFFYRFQVFGYLKKHFLIGAFDRVSQTGY